MANGDETILALRESLKFSPDNLPLRMHLADSLMGLGRYEEAEKEYRLGLAASGGEARFKVGLAHAFFQLGKNSEAIVIVEELLKGPDVPAKLLVLYCRLLLRAGDVERAVRQYKRAVDSDPSVVDLELSQRLGIRSEEEPG
ncbi:MAG TPA: tetratricopeptide repeat protein, partial [Tepidisphaeraceae bacterium]|nr:tetratricopeptide repeat protein [Tepidisphaeraceae bacterium]